MKTKNLICFLAATIICYTTVAQNYLLTPEQIEAKKRLEKAKIEFINGQYENVLSYYDSVSNGSKYFGLITYKMASQSCMELSRVNKIDSVLHIEKREKIYSEALKWHGKMLVEERWDSLKIEILEEPEVLQVIEQQPKFPGGLAAFYKSIGQKMRYPAEARQMGIEGRVYVQFIINKDGSVDAINVVKGIGGGCDEEALRVMREVPNFIPGTQNGKPVYVRMSLPIVFKLAGKSKKKKKRRG
ncbi:MAG: energy transducer TonB [Cytophagales bacterium]|nr:energy transducer TonB [Cytophagales bacterium]